MDGPIKEEDIASGYIYCWKCWATEVEVNSEDSVYRLMCNECYKHRKEEWSLQWMQTRKSALVGCQFCWDTFKFKRKSEFHMCPFVVAYQCRLCAYKLNSNKSLNEHLQVAHDVRGHWSNGEESIKCKFCKMAFTCFEHLKVHLKTHKGDKLFKCKNCKKSFTQSGHLTIHFKTHTGEKSFECKICNKAFIHSGNLKLHLRTHTGEKPFKCEICKKTFVQSGHLTTHLKTHTGEKPFDCKICKKAFAQTGHLTTHLKTHSKGKVLCTKI